MRGAPKARVGGGTRGPGGQGAVLQVLAPDHAGFTTQSQPTLYWYASSPVSVRLDFSIISDDEIDPLLEIETGNKHVAGIQKLNLSDHNISLQHDVSYQWSVAIVSDVKSRSSDVVASGFIKRIKPSASLVEKIGSSHGIERVAAYANEVPGSQRNPSAHQRPTSLCTLCPPFPVLPQSTASDRPSSYLSEQQMIGRGSSGIALQSMPEAMGLSIAKCNREIVAIR